MLVFLDKFFFAFHSAVIVFALFGWACRKTRKANLAVILFIAFSWFILGIWYGYGYCPCTDWHWRVREGLGFVDMPSSYTKFLIDKVTGWDVDQRSVDVLTLVLLAAAFSVSLAANFGDWRKRRRSRVSGKSTKS